MMILRTARVVLALLLLAPLASAQLLPPDELAGGKAVSPPILRPSLPYNVEVASDGSEFVAVWNDDRYGEADVFAARISADGKLREPHPLTISTAGGWDAPVALIWNGNDYALFLRSEPPGSRIVSILRDGTAKERKSIDSLQAVSAAWNGSRYAVVLSNTTRTGTQLRYFDRDFNELESVTFGQAGGQDRRVSVTAGDGRFLVTWVDSRRVGSEDVRRLYFQLFDERGNALTALRELAFTSTAGTNLVPSVSWNGTSFLAIWTELSRVGGAVISRSGEIGRSFEIAAGPEFGSPTISWDGRVHLVVWEKRPVQMVYAVAVLSSTGDVLDRFPVQAGALVLEGPAIAANGQEFVVLAAGRLVGVRPAAAERTIDYGPFSYAYLRQTAPVITAGSSQLVTAWSEGGEATYASRVSPSGSRIGGAIHLGSGPGAQPITAASAGDVHLIAWRLYGGTTTRLVLLSDSGEVREIIGVPADARSNAVAVSSGSDFALLWTKAQETADAPVTLMMSWISKQGGLASHVIASHVVGSGTAGLTVSSAGWTGTAYGVFWRRQLTAACQFPTCPPPQYEDHLTRITREGVIISDVVVPARGVVASIVDEKGALRVSMAGTGMQIDVERVRFDGSTVPAVRSTATHQIPYDGKLVRTDTGYALVGNVYDYSAPSRGFIVTMHLDPSGRLLQSVVRYEGDTVVRGAVWAFGSLWTTFTAQWKPLPPFHNGVVQRAYYRATAPRTRAVR